jgi:hypothetical protein
MVVNRRNIRRGSDMKKAELDLEKLILQFAQSNKVEGLSPRTTFWYSQILTGYLRFLGSTGRKPALKDFNISLVREFIIREQERDLSP